MANRRKSGLCKILAKAVVTAGLLVINWADE
jgi:hypothetical protein